MALFSPVLFNRGREPSVPKVSTASPPAFSRVSRGLTWLHLWRAGSRGEGKGARARSSQAFIPSCTSPTSAQLAFGKRQPPVQDDWPTSLLSLHGRLGRIQAFVLAKGKELFRKTSPFHSPHPQPHTLERLGRKVCSVSLCSPRPCSLAWKPFDPKVLGVGSSVVRKEERAFTRLN